MSSYKKIPLGEVASYINGYAFKPIDWGKSGLPIIRIQNLTDENKEFNYYEGNFDKKYLIVKGDILISWSASLGVYEWNKSDAILNQHIFKVVFDKIQIDKKYFFFALKKILKEAIKNTHGSTMKHITRPQFEKILFPFYELEKQKKIAKILENISNIIEKKKQKLQKYDDLSKSIFIEMFGDLNFKHRVWERKKFSELCQINPTKNEIKELEDNIEVSFIPMSAVSIDGIVNVAEKVKLKKVKTGFTFFKENDVLFAKITPCMENGKGGIVKNLKNGIGFGSTEFHVLRPLKNISTSYWLYYVTMLPQFRKNAENMMTGSGGQKRVPSSYFETLKINVPSIELQNQFAERIKIIEKSKIEIQKSIEETQKLFDSLMEKYFG